MPGIDHAALKFAADATRALLCIIDIYDEEPPNICELIQNEVKALRKAHSEVKTAEKVALPAVVFRKVMGTIWGQ